MEQLVGHVQVRGVWTADTAGGTVSTLTSGSLSNSPYRLALELEKPLRWRSHCCSEPLESGESNNLLQDITTYHNYYSIIIGRKKSNFMLVVGIETIYSTVFFVCFFVPIHLKC